jgi:hypothetical protein
MVPPPSTAATTPTVTRQNVLPDADGQNILPDPDVRYKYDAYGPWQYSVFNGTNRDNIYRASTGRTTGPVDDSELLPANEDER